MSKIIIACLAIAAFAYAVWLVVSHRRLPNPKHHKGLQRRFVLATLLFVGLLAATFSRAGRPPKVTCYDIAIPRHEIRQPVTARKFGVALKAIWRTLDPERNEEFRNKVEAVAAEGKIRKKTAKMLAIAFQELAYHKQRTRGKGLHTMCYEMTPLGGTLYTTRENALKQLELLAKARESGAIDSETAAKAHAVLAREVEILHRAKGVERAQDWWLAEQSLTRQYKANKIVASDVASVTAAIIVEMEDGRVAHFTPAKRLADMKKRVQELLSVRIGGKGFQGGPAGNDWMNPAIQPNVYAVLVKAGLLEKKAAPVVSCYLTATFPVQARSDELKKLQQELLNKNVKAGVLDVEVADKAAIAAAKEPDADYATEKDIQVYQKKLRRAVRLMYKRGELPSSFVEQLERAADIEIISFNPTKALHNDMRYYLRSVLWHSIGDEALNILEQRKLIPAKRNHRLIMRILDNGPQVPDSQKKRLAEFETLIDSEDAFELPGDNDVHILQSRIPSTDTKYRLKMRRVGRALVKTGLLHRRQLKQLEEVIGVPIVGKFVTGRLRVGS
jgi:hypothetical protein